MKKVIKDDVYITESGRKSLKVIDFSDTFSTTNHIDSVEAITKLMFSTMPCWMLFLFKMRSKIVNITGLKTEFTNNELAKIKEGVSLGFFKTYKVSESEIILGADDHHLNFRALINNTNSKTYNIKVTTLVEYNNRKGVLYMRLIKPFHELVLKQMVKKVYKV